MPRYRPELIATGLDQLFGADTGYSALPVSRPSRVVCSSLSVEIRRREIEAGGTGGTGILEERFVKVAAQALAEKQAKRAVWRVGTSGE